MGMPGLYTEVATALEVFMELGGWCSGPKHTRIMAFDAPRSELGGNFSGYKA